MSANSHNSAYAYLYVPVGNDVGAQEGILASTSTGVVTDTTWKCTTALEPDWSTCAFDDSNWPDAVSRGANGVGPWGQFDDIDATAEWIWAKGSDNGVVYCRKRLRDGRWRLCVCIVFIGPNVNCVRM